MIECLTCLADDTLVISAHETVSDDDYEKVLIPAVEEKLQRYRKIRLLYHLGADFTGYSPAAVWDDAKFGTRFADVFERIAVVTDVPWLVYVARTCSLFVSCPVRTFENRRYSEAREWLAAG